jgi:hypothetical protein
MILKHMKYYVNQGIIVLKVLNIPVRQLFMAINLDYSVPLVVALVLLDTIVVPPPCLIWNSLVVVLVIIAL